MFYISFLNLLETFSKISISISVSSSDSERLFKKAGLLMTSSGLALVLFLSSLVQVSLTTAKEQLDSIPKLFSPLIILKVPFSPHHVPHEFLPTQYGSPGKNSPYPKIEISWFNSVV
jgi:hypothetical protein